MKRLVSFATLNILLLVFICFKLSESANKPKKISIQEFPMTVGSQWTYLRTDSLFQSIHYQDTRRVEQETVTVQVTREHRTGNKGKTLEWVRTFSNKVDTEYVVTKGDTVTLLTSMDTTKSEAVFHFVFPLEKGKRWQGESENSDSVSYGIVGPDSVTVPAGKFTNSYLITRMTWMPEDSTFARHFPVFVNYWVVPEIGIIKINKWAISFFGSSTKSTTWELIRYDIKK